jgi:hypothetical protein
LDVEGVMEKSEEFQFLYQSLVDGNKEYVDFITKVLAVLLIAIGWLVANDNPFPILCNRLLMWGSIGINVVGIILISWISIFHYERANKRYELLKVLNYAKEPLYEHYKISKNMIGPVIFFHVILLVGIIALIYGRYG